MRFYRFCFILLWISSPLSAAPVDPEEQKANRILRTLYHHQASDKALSMPARLEKISRLFLNQPYYWGALGEGFSGRYDQYPLYRVDQFDCQTFVETVLALALSDGLPSFQREMKQIRYRDGQVSFITRNHFTDLDWNRNNQRRGILHDITLRLHNEHHQSVAKIARTFIDKPSWYQHFSKEKIRLLVPDALLQKKRLYALKQRGKTLKAQWSSIPYIPLTALLSPSGQPNQALFQQIPDGAIIEIIRPNWDLRKAIGTHLNVSHFGFAFWIKGVLIFRNASMTQGKVVDQSLIDYLRDAQKSPSIKGINIQMV